MKGVAGIAEYPVATWNAHVRELRVHAYDAQLRVIMLVIRGRWGGFALGCCTCY
jgi:hypothetical protein